MTLQILLGIDLPVVQAPMVGVQDEALALAVSAAGGLGSMPCAVLDRSQLESALQRFAGRPNPINLNFFCHAMTEPDSVQELRWREALAPYYREFDIERSPPTTNGVRRPIDDAVVDLLEHYRPKVLSFHFGLPSPHLLKRIKAWGGVLLASATSLDEGRWLERHGADVVIAQGIEAGGHRGHFLSDDLTLQASTRELVAQLVPALRVPIIAAGGIATRADVQQMFDAGASAVQAGTAYLLCPEAKTSVVHRAALARPSADTALTNLFSGRPARGIVNRLMHDIGALSDLAPAFPWAAQALAPLRTRAEALGRDDFSPLWAGTNHHASRRASAASVTRMLAGIPE